MSEQFVAVVCGCDSRGRSLRTIATLGPFPSWEEANSAGAARSRKHKEGENGDVDECDIQWDVCELEARA